MRQRTGKRKSSTSLRKLKSTLTEIAMTAPSKTFAEGESYVCAVCQDVARLCDTDPSIRCSHMILEGTELQLLREGERKKNVYCLRCGAPLPQRVLQRNPLAELCPTCQQSSKKSKSSKR